MPIHTTQYGLGSDGLRLPPAPLPFVSAERERSDESLIPANSFAAPAPSSTAERVFQWQPGRTRQDVSHDKLMV